MSAADIDMLKRKADNGADRALTQFFFDNDNFERYLEKVRAAGIKIPIVPGIMPIQNLTQLKRFASACGTVIPAFLDERFAGLDDKVGRTAEGCGRCRGRTDRGSRPPRAARVSSLYHEPLAACLGCAQQPRPQS